MEHVTVPRTRIPVPLKAHVVVPGGGPACSLKQSDQAVYWMELLIGAGFVTPEDMAPIMGEARELISHTLIPSP